MREELTWRVGSPEVVWTHVDTAGNFHRNVSGECYRLGTEERYARVARRKPGETWYVRVGSQDHNERCEFMELDAALTADEAKAATMAMFRLYFAGKDME